MQKYFNDRHVDIGFSRKLNVFVWSCVKRLGTSGFKFPAKGSLSVILSSMGNPDRELEGNHVPTFNAHARCSGKCNAHFLLGKR